MSYSASTMGLPELRHSRSASVRRLLADSFGQAEKNASAILRRGLRPSAGIERCLRGGYGSIDVFFIRFGNFGDDFFGGRIVNRENARRCALRQIRR